ncbi:MAG: hypothetical protein ABWX56_08615 [Mycetocola sp.]
MIDSVATAIGAIAALGGLVAAFFLFRSYPRVLMVTWALVLFFVPIWVGAQAGVYFSALIVVTILGIASASLDGLRWSVVDSLMVVFVSLLVVATVVGGATWGHVTIVLFDWMIPYVWGRVVLSRIDIDWVHGAIAAAAVALSLVAIAEFLSGTNLFISIATSNPQFQTWSGLQPRGGLLRVEASFGHSIALGSSLAIAAVFVAVAKWPAWLRLTSLTIVLTATGMTFSRIGLVGILLALVLSVTFLGPWLGRSFRVALGILVATIAAVGIPLVWNVFAEAGAEAAGSAEYRGDLVSLLSDSAILGITPTWTVLPTGDTYYGSFQSIDSALILTALRFGLVPVGVLVVALAVCLVSMFRGRATPASVAVLAQVPAFVTVALITQYANFVWFTAGLAVASYSFITRREEISPVENLVARPKIEQGGERT